MIGLPYYQPVHTAKGWRIMLSQNGYEMDVCGAVDEKVAWEQCAIFNTMRRLQAMTKSADEPPPD